MWPVCGLHSFLLRYCFGLLYLSEFSIVIFEIINLNKIFRVSLMKIISLGLELILLKIITLKFFILKLHTLKFKIIAVHFILLKFILYGYYL